MHDKRDKNRSVNVLRPAALTLAVPLRFVVCVRVRVCACVCTRVPEKMYSIRARCAKFDYQLPFLLEGKKMNSPLGFDKLINCHQRKMSV